MTVNSFVNHVFEQKNVNFGRRASGAMEGAGRAQRAAGSPESKKKHFQNKTTKNTPNGAKCSVNAPKRIFRAIRGCERSEPPGWPVSKKSNFFNFRNRVKWCHKMVPNAAQTLQNAVSERFQVARTLLRAGDAPRAFRRRPQILFGDLAALLLLWNC